MPIDTCHPDYTASMSAWIRCADAAAGSDAVKAKGVDYLPKLSGQTHAEYEAYLKRAMFYPVTDRTVIGLCGAVLRRPPVITVPRAVQPHFADITLDATPFSEFSYHVLREILLKGRCGVMVDMPLAATESTRPYWVLYVTEDIINWRTARLPNGGVQLSFVVLKERAVNPAVKDPFMLDEVTRYRVLNLVNGVYVVTTWQKLKDGNWMSDKPVIPLRKGKPLDFIPFVIFGAQGISTTMTKSPLLDLVDVNLSHYRNSADLEHGRHFVALPTPWISGWTDPQDGTTSMRIGSGTAWTFPNPDARVGMLEFTGAGLTALVTALEHKERMMATLGSRLLEKAPNAAETAEAVKLRLSGESSVLETISASCSQALSKAALWHTWWTGIDANLDTVGVELNRDFFDTKMAAPEAQALMALWQAGGISYETFYWNLQRGEWARPGITDAEERELIAATENALDAADAAGLASGVDADEEEEEEEGPDA